MTNMFLLVRYKFLQANGHHISDNRQVRYDFTNNLGHLEAHRDISRPTVAMHEYSRILYVKRKFKHYIKTGK